MKRVVSDTCFDPLSQPRIGGGTTVVNRLTLDEGPVSGYKGVVADYYDILGVSRRATADEISAAYKALVMKYHPDQHEQNDLRDLAEDKLKQINEAYGVLKDARRRRLYDAGMTTPFQGPTGGVRVARPNLVRTALVWAVWLIGVPFILRLSHNPPLFMGLIGAFVAWRVWRRIKQNR